MSRRQLLGGGLGAAAMAMLGGASAPAWAGLARKGVTVASPHPAKLAFNRVAKSLADAVMVPEGYRFSVLFRLGDPIAPEVGEYRNDGLDDAESFVLRAGDHHDYMRLPGAPRMASDTPSSATNGIPLFEGYLRTLSSGSDRYAGSRRLRFLGLTWS